MDPDFSRARFYLGWIYEQKAMYAEAIPEFQKAWTLSGNPQMLAALAHAYAASGKQGEARQALAELKELSKGRYVAPLDMAIVYIGLGERELALEWLEKACEDHSYWLIWLKTDPRFDSLHGHPRYRELLRRMGLPP